MEQQNPVTRVKMRKFEEEVQQMSRSTPETLCHFCFGGNPSSSTV